MTREDVERECQWLIEEHCSSASRKWMTHDQAQRAVIERLQTQLATAKEEVK